MLSQAKGSDVAVDHRQSDTATQADHGDPVDDELMVSNTLHAIMLLIMLCYVRLLKLFKSARLCHEACFTESTHLLCCFVYTTDNNSICLVRFK